MENRSTSRSLSYHDLGQIDYQEAWDLQRSLFEKRLKGEIHDTLLLLEHPHTYTFGKSADKKNLLGDDDYLREKGIKIYDIDRGGDVTYHGPGQIVGYAIFDLNNWKKDTNLFLRAIEEVIIKTCGNYGLQTSRMEKHTGVWIEDRKICAIGIKVSRWITMHGFALNVNTDLDLFNGIIPCGINDKGVTSLQKELCQEFDIQNVKEIIVRNMKNIFEYNEVKSESY
ncbi:Octanoate-[acyl-carrier-protein]-protein-N-octanoyltransferase [hydrothermal vent metagenome]|uniref:lipoyl(octanoyl) transferase n=1 Tax=hydrothermal vent metagenome TaxID=652676 RepID=A0A3B1BZV3_9ZZZZ